MRPSTAQNPTPSKKLSYSEQRQANVTFVSEGSAGGNSNEAAASSSYYQASSGFSSAEDFESGERTPITAAIDNATYQIKSCELNLKDLNERVNELHTNDVKSKQLEAELAPRESETKNVVSAFHRMMESGTRVKKGRGGGAKKSSGSPGSASLLDDDRSDGGGGEGDSESQVSRSEAGGGANKPHHGGATAAAGGGRSRYGLHLPGAKDDLSREEIADRDSLRLLAHKIRHFMLPVFSELFFLPPTQREQHKALLLQQQAEAAEALKEQQLLREQQQQQAGGSSAAANSNNASRGSSSSSSSSGGRRSGQQSGGKHSTAGGSSSGGGAGATSSSLAAAIAQFASASGGINPLTTDRLDPDLYLIPGVDPNFFHDVLNLRQSRLAAEKALKKTQEQLATARSIVTKRRADGSNKSAVRKAEKALATAKLNLRELHTQREENELRKKLAIAADNESGSSSQQKAGGRIPSKPARPAANTNNNNKRR